MDTAPADALAFGDCAVNRECPECIDGVLIIVRSYVRNSRRHRLMGCKSCGYRNWRPDDDIEGTRNRRPRRFDEATIKEIRASAEGRRILAQQYGCSEELIRAIRAGQVYRDLLPDGFRAPPGPGDPNCERCLHWAGDACGMGFPDPEMEGPAFAQDCSVFVVRG